MESVRGAFEKRGHGLPTITPHAASDPKHSQNYVDDSYHRSSHFLDITMFLATQGNEGYIVPYRMRMIARKTPFYATQAVKYSSIPVSMLNWDHPNSDYDCDPEQCKRFLVPLGIGRLGKGWWLNGSVHLGRLDGLKASTRY